MSKKQTAIEWLIDELNEMGIRYLDLAEEQINKALQLEREQMIDFAKYCSKNTDYVTSYEDCYTQTYGKCTQQS